MEERRLELESWLISALGLRPKEESLLTFLNQSADDFVGLRLALEAAAPAAAYMRVLTWVPRAHRPLLMSTSRDRLNSRSEVRFDH